MNLLARRARLQERIDKLEKALAAEVAEHRTTKRARLRAAPAYIETEGYIVMMHVYETICKPWGLLA